MWLRQAEVLMVGLELFFLGQNLCLWPERLLSNFIESGKSAQDSEGLAGCERQTAPECDSVLQQYQTPVIAKVLWNPDMTWINL